MLKLADKYLSSHSEYSNEDTDSPRVRVKSAAAMARTPFGNRMQATLGLPRAPESLVPSRPITPRLPAEREGKANTHVRRKESIVNRFLQIHPAASAGGRRTTKLGAMIHDRLGMMRKRVQLVYQECLQVSMCQLQAAKASTSSPSRARGLVPEKGPRHAWPHAFVAPLLWLPFYLSAQSQLRRVLPASESADNSRTARQITTLDLGSKPKREDHSVEKVTLQAPGKVELSVNSGKLRKAFWAAVSEARLAQAQSLAAWRDVQSLTAALERGKQSAKRRQRLSLQRQRAPNKGRPGGGGGGAFAANAAAVTQLRSQLQAQQTQLKRTEASLRKELLDVDRQIHRLYEELQRREQRLVVLPIEHRAICDDATVDGCQQFENGLELADVNLAGSIDAGGVSPRAVGAPAEPLPKFLTSSRVLPDISATAQTPRQLRHTPRSPLSQRAHGPANIAGSPRYNTPKQSRPKPGQGSTLPSLAAWRCGTAPA